MCPRHGSSGICKSQGALSGIPAALAVVPFQHYHDSMQNERRDIGKSAALAMAYSTQIKSGPLPESRGRLMGGDGRHTMW